MRERISFLFFWRDKRFWTFYQAVINDVKSDFFFLSIGKSGLGKPIRVAYKYVVNVSTSLLVQLLEFNEFLFQRFHASVPQLSEFKINRRSSQLDFGTAKWWAYTKLKQNILNSTDSVPTLKHDTQEESDGLDSTEDVAEQIK